MALAKDVSFQERENGEALAVLASTRVHALYTEFRGEADYRVYLTDFRGEDTAGGMFDDCEFTRFRGAASWKIYLTKFKGDADLIVYRKEFATR